MKISRKGRVLILCASKRSRDSNVLHFYFKIYIVNGLPYMYEHVGQKPPELVPSSRIVYENSGGRPRPSFGGIHLVRFVDYETSEFDRRNEKHGERWRAAGILLFVYAVCFVERFRSLQGRQFLDSVPFDKTNSLQYSRVSLPMTSRGQYESHVS